MWRKVISELYGVNGGFDINYGTGLKNGVWNGIISNCYAIDNLDIPFNNSIVKRLEMVAIRDFGKRIGVKRVGGLWDLYPRLYALESFNNGTVKDRWIFDNGSWRGEIGYEDLLCVVILWMTSLLLTLRLAILLFL